MRKNAGDTRRGRPFAAGNPGRPCGARNKTTVTVEALLEGEAEAIGRKCVEQALAGDSTALRLAMERLAPVRRGRPVRFELPALDRAADLPAALGALLQQMSIGAITPEEAGMIAGVIEAKRKALETLELESRIAALEQTRDARR